MQVDVGRDEGDGEEEMDSSTLSVVCDSLPPLSKLMEATTLKGKFARYQELYVFSQGVIDG